MSDEKIELVNNKSIKIDGIMQYNESLIEKITEELGKYKEKDDDMDEATLLILEKQIGIINFIKRLNDGYKKVLKRIEKDANAGKKTTLKKMKKETSSKKKVVKKKNDEEDDEQEAPKKKATEKKKKESSEPKKKKTTSKKTVSFPSGKVINYKK